MEILELTKNLRNRLTDYRFSMKGIVISTHVNAVDIVVSLVEYSIESKRPISLEEQNWFEASYYVNFFFSGSDWEDISDMYSQLVAEVRDLNYFRQK